MENITQTDTGTKDHDYILELFGGLNSVMAAFAAIDLEIFDIMAKPKGPVSAKTIAAEKDYDEEQTTRLLNALVSLKLVERITYSDGTDMYQNTGSGRLLAHCEPDNLLGIVHRLQHRFVEIVRNKKLSEEVRKGALKKSEFPPQVTVHKHQSPPQATSPKHHSPSKRHSTEAKAGQETKDEDDHAQKKEDLYSRYVAYDNILVPHVETIVNAFDFSIHQTAVDLGAGSGTLSFAFCERYPDMKLTIFEVPPVIEMIRERFLPANEGVDVHLRAGDFMDEHKLPAADLYLVSQIIHDWRPDQVDFILDKVFKALLPGGGILLLEQLLDDDRCGPLDAAVRDLFIMSHCGGALRTVSETTELLTKHKFSEIQVVRTQPACMYDIVYARKQHSH